MSFFKRYYAGIALGSLLLGSCSSNEPLTALVSPDRPSTYCASSVEDYASYTISQVENTTVQPVEVQTAALMGQGNAVLSKWSLIPLPVQGGKSLPLNGKGRAIPDTDITSRTAGPHTTLFVSVVLKWSHLKTTPSLVDGVQLTYKNADGSIGTVQTKVRLGASSSTTGCELAASETSS